MANYYDVTLPPEKFEAIASGRKTFMIFNAFDAKHGDMIYFHERADDPKGPPSPRIEKSDCTGWQLSAVITYVEAIERFYPDFIAVGFRVVGHVDPGNARYTVRGES